MILPKVHVGRWLMMWSVILESFALGAFDSVQTMQSQKKKKKRRSGDNLQIVCFDTDTFASYHAYKRKL